MEIRRAMEEFLTALKESSSYKDYHYQKERVKRVPGLAERINDFRAKRFEFQNYQGDDLFEKIDEFEKQYVSQGSETDRSIEETLDIGWKLLSILPRSELRRISDEFLDKYYIEKC